MSSGAQCSTAQLHDVAPAPSAFEALHPQLASPQLAVQNSCEQFNVSECRLANLSDTADPAWNIRLSTAVLLS
jgi:hypothetical protein